ncbi:hypothetical protein PG987_001911 [Apiospora arundinis]
MADPLSVAASAAGLVSLGLTVTGGVAKYTDALKCRTEDLASVRQRNQSLRRTIRFIEVAKSQLQLQLSHQQSAASLTAVDESIKACKIELVKLEALMHNLLAIETQEHRKKLTYAFDRSKVDQLALRLDHTIHALQLALDGLGLRQAASDAKTIQSEIASLQLPIKSIATDINHGFNSMEGRLMTSIQAVQTEGLEGRLLVRQDIGEAFAGFESRVLARLENHWALNDGPQLCHRLASKPATFKDLLDEVSEVQDIEATPWSRRTRVKSSASSRGNSLCVCPYRRNVKQKATTFGLISIYSETNMRSHEPYCALAHTKVTKQQSSKSGIRFHGLVRLMKVVLDISLNITTGAGGAQYKPNVHILSDYPAFRILNQIIDDYEEHCDSSCRRCFSCWGTCMRIAIKKLERLVLTGNANPRAVDMSNWSWCHFAVDLGSTASMTTR